MSNLSMMSRTALVRELLASPPVAAMTETSSPYLRPHESPDTFVNHRLAVAREILLRDLSTQLQSGPVLSSPDAVRHWLTLRCMELQHEIFLVLYLDVRNHLIEDEEIFRGTLTQTSVYPREVVKSALAHNAAAVILAHNHPSGHPEPSSADRLLTTQLRTALLMVDVQVLDHLVVAGDSIVSFAEQGLL